MSRAQELKTKFGYVKPADDKAAEKAFEKSELTDVQRQDVVRLSKRPATTGTRSLEDVFGEITAIEQDTVGLLQEEDALSVKFSDFLKTKGIYTFGQKVHITAMKVLLQREKAKALERSYAADKGRNLDNLATRIGEVYVEKIAKEKENIDLGETLKRESLAHMKYLQQEIIRCWQEGTEGLSDQTGAELEIKKMALQVAEVDKALEVTENEYKLAREAGNMDEVKRLTAELSELVDVKYALLDGKAGAEGEALRIRKEITQRAKGKEVAQSALAMEELNYTAFNAFINAHTDLLILYEENSNKAIPVFKRTALGVRLGMDAERALATVKKVNEISQRLGQAQADLASTVAYKAFNAIKEPTYDLPSLRAKKAELEESMEALNESRKQWVELSNTISEANQAVAEMEAAKSSSASPGYAKRR